MITKVLLDPSFRRTDIIFTVGDLQRIHEVADVVWGSDEPIPDDRLTAVAVQSEIHRVSF